MLFKIGFLKDVDLTGKWEATFSCGGKEYTELIELKTKLGSVTGYIIDGDKNYEAIRKVAKESPIRLKGTINDNRYFTGFWYHPVETSRFHGAFQLLISHDSNYITGQWIGFSQSTVTIENGNWTFSKIIED